MTRARDLSRLANSNAFSVDASNRIGIGSTVPRADLDVVGNVLIGDDISIQSGIVTATTFSGNITGVAATFTGNVSIAGTLTYEDVTNIDSVGLITARSGVVLTGGDITLGTGTTISAPTSNEFAVSTNGTQRIRINADGDVDIDSGGVFYDATNNRLAIGTTVPAVALHVDGGTNSQIALVSTTTSAVEFGDAAKRNQGLITYDHSADAMTFRTNGSGEDMRIDSSGRLLVGTSSSTKNSLLETNIHSVVQGNGALGGAMFTAYCGTSSAISRSSVLGFQRSRGTTDGSMTLVANGDRLGNVFFRGADGTNFVDAASIQAFVDGTPGTDDMPGRLVFSTSPGSPTTAPLERMRITNDGYVRLASGSGGIQFNDDTAAANALDDYEEGTWTPAITRRGTNPSVTYLNRTGKYTKIGNQVLIYFDMTIYTISGGTGRYQIDDLPFNSVTDSSSGGFGSPVFRASAAFNVDARINNTSAFHSNGDNTIPLLYMNNSGTEVDITVGTGRITGWSMYFTS